MHDVALFLSHIAEILEVSADRVDLATDFRRDLPDWDSMKGFAIIVMLADDYGLTVEIPDFLNCRTIGDLWALVQARE